MRTSIWAVMALVIAGCSYDLGEVRDPLGDDIDAVTWDDMAPPFAPPADDEAPTIEITDVVDLEDGTAQLTGISADDRAVVALEVLAGLSGPYPIPAPIDGFAAWAAIVPVPSAGPITFEAKVFDEGGRSGVASVTLERPRPQDMTAPTLTITAPADGLETNAGSLFVEGTAEDASGVRSVEVVMMVDGGDELPLGMARTADHFAHWAIEAPVSPGAETTYIARARDSAERLAEARVTVISRAAPPHAAPVLVESTPADGATVAARDQTLDMVFESGSPLAAVLVRVGDGPGQPAMGAGPMWSVPIRLRPDDNPISIIARDADGLVSRTVITIRMDDGFGDGPVIALGAPTPPGGEVHLDLDKDGAAAMFPVEVQRETILMYLDPRDMVTNALGQIRELCGPGWTAPGFEPDCPAEWGAPERNLWGLLTMTPNSTNVAGTGFEELAVLSVDLIGVSFGEILGDALGLELDQVVLPDEPLVDAIIELLIGSHANAGPGGTLPVSLEAGLQDMKPLGCTFGRDEQGHPGFIASGEECAGAESGVQAAVLTADFRMQLTLISNLRLYEGVDLARARKEYFADRPPEVGVVDLEFLDPTRFDMSGIAPVPLVTMDFQMLESDESATPGTALTPIGLGDSDVWGFPSWSLERIVARSSINAFDTLRTGCDLCDPLGGELAYRSDGARDLAEVVIGRVGYDCDPADLRSCPNQEPTPDGLPERFTDRLDAYDCGGGLGCGGFSDAYECHRQGRCVETAAIACDRDQNCAAGELCVFGDCMPAAEVVCRFDADCPAAQVCHDNACIEVPAGWFRFWMPPGVVRLPSPAYMWDIVLEVAQARMLDGGVAQGEGDATFHLEGVPAGLTDAFIESEVRQQLQAQREELADALLGKYTDPDLPVDLFIDVFDGAGWLMVSQCRLGLAHPQIECRDLDGDGEVDDPLGCVDPADLCVPDQLVGLYRDAGAAQPSRLDRAAPSTLTGVPLAELAVGDVLYFRAADGGVQRVDVDAVEATSIQLWLRGAAR